MSQKTLKELDLLDRFLFARTIEDKETYQDLLELLLEEDIKLLTETQTEKEIRTMPWLRSIRVDVFSMDEARRIFNTESQKENTYNLPKRSRYYQSLIDGSLLEPGSTNFNLLNDVIMIMIMPFDLFGHGKYRYTFRMKCEEVDGLDLKDGAVRIFFNTHGKNTEEVSPELIELLDFIENTTKRAGKRSKNDKIRRIQEQVHRIKVSEEMGVRYMQEWEEKALAHEKGIKEGKERGITQTTLLIKYLLNDNRVEDLKRAVEDSEYQKVLLKEYGLE